MGWRYRAGLLLIFIVVIMWVTSAEITQSIFTEYKHPFAVTYLGTSLLAAYLPIAFMRDWLLKFLRSCSYNSDKSCLYESSQVLDSPTHNICTHGKFDIEEQQPLADEKCIKDIHSQKEGKPTVFDSKDDDVDSLIHRKLVTKEIATLGLFIGPIWFASEVGHRLFTLLIGALLGDDSINVINLVSVFVSMAGVAMTAYGKTWATDESETTTSSIRNHSFLGYLFALLSAMTDGLFTVLLKKFAGEDGEKVDMQKLIGYIGLFSLVSLWWLVWPLTALGFEPKFIIPDSAQTVGVVFANCFAGSFLSDYFWALGVVWTTPLVAALGASLTIPLAMLEDMVIHGRHYSTIYILGSVQVFLGFAIANVSDWFTPKSGFQFLNSLERLFIPSPLPNLTM
ncbi:hypothetical protein FH972_002288 [Carpinus fangiana]|uniref:EamA domain-containing protein n=1 Tax=Carpinus fangiana TaxID=176857 RepID=A0A5N6QEE1_9ROSI|nr:hypothetical protein FH972_002288 [Carpinus fangiana]